MIAIFSKEIHEFLNSLIAYVVIGVFLIAMGLLMWIFPDTNVLSYGYASMEPVFSLGPYVLLFLVPAITMRSFAEEKRNGTMELLQTLPFREMDIVLGKFFAGYFLVFFSILPTGIYFVSLYRLGNPVGNLDVSGIIGSYIGLLALGGIFTAFGLLASCLTGNQIVSFILAGFLCFLFYSGFDSLAGIDLWSGWSGVIGELGILSHYQSLSRGVIDMGDLAYFVCLIVFILVFTRFLLSIRK